MPFFHYRNVRWNRPDDEECAAIRQHGVRDALSIALHCTCFSCQRSYNFFMLGILRMLGWLACIVYSTIPLFWLMVHPLAKAWRRHPGSPFQVLVPIWLLIWVIIGMLTAPWRNAALYSTLWGWVPASALLAAGTYLYRHAGTHFSLAQLGGVPEVRAEHKDDRLVTSGIRARVRHPIYLAHFCEMLAWSTGTGLAVCWLLTGFAIVTGTLMIRLEDAELERRFGDEYRSYREHVGAVVPRLR